MGTIVGVGSGGFYAAMTLPAGDELVAAAGPEGGYRRHLVRCGETIGAFCPSIATGTADR